MSIADALREAELLAQSTDIPMADYLYLLSEVTGYNNVELLLEKAVELSDTQAELWKAYSERRTAGEPSQYIIGKAYFFGFELRVGPGVLIPRPETEGLVELVLQHSKPGQKVIDIGTGSGAIAIALKSIHPDLCVSATDISTQALTMAQGNAQRLGVEIDFIEADLFPARDTRYDIIISNPPYISQTDYDQLPDHIRCHEPSSALLAAEEGTIIYRRILERIPQHANPGALICFEIGANQAGPIKAIAKKLGLHRIEIAQDSASLDRYLMIKTQGGING